MNLFYVFFLFSFYNLWFQMCYLSIYILYVTIFTALNRIVGLNCCGVNSSYVTTTMERNHSLKSFAYSYHMKAGHRSYYIPPYVLVIYITRSLYIMIKYFCTRTHYNRFKYLLETTKQLISQIFIQFAFCWCIYWVSVITTHVKVAVCSFYYYHCSAVISYNLINRAFDCIMWNTNIAVYRYYTVYSILYNVHTSCGTYIEFRIVNNILHTTVLVTITILHISSKYTIRHVLTRLEARLIHETHNIWNS